MAFLGSFSHLSSLSAFLLFPLFPVCLRRSALQFLLPFGPTFPFFFSVRLFSAFPLFCCLFFFLVFSLYKVILPCHNFLLFVYTNNTLPSLSPEHTSSSLLVITFFEDPRHFLAIPLPNNILDQCLPDGCRRCECFKFA